MITLRDPVVFIGGCPRSGTTLLRNLLNAHPDLAIPNEAYFVGHVMSDVISGHQRGDVAEVWNTIRARNEFLEWDADLGRFDDAVRQFTPRGFADLVRLLYGVYASHHGKPLAGDKTTENIGLSHWLAPLFPQAVFVHVVRDPRSVSMSLALQHWMDGSLEGAAFVWHRHAQRGVTAADRLGKKLLTIRYEDLVSDTEVTLASVCRHVGIEFHDSMIAGYAQGGLRERHHHSSRNPIRPDLRDWRREMSPSDIALVEHAAGPLMGTYGYASVSGRARRALKAPRYWLYVLKQGLEWRALTRRGARVVLPRTEPTPEALARLGVTGS